MNQEKIGKFIQEKRKEKELTQIELAERLGVSNRSISKWETGRCLPDYAVLPMLCDELDITINELLSGEELDDENYRKKLEENIIGTIEYNNKKRNKKIKKTIILFIVFIVICLLYKAFIVYIYFKDWRSEDEKNNEFPNRGNIETIYVKDNNKANTKFGNDFNKQINIFIPNEFEFITDKAKSSYVQDNCDFYAKDFIDDQNFGAEILICNDYNDFFYRESQLFPYINESNLFEKYGISNSSDLLKYYEKNSDIKQNIFTSSDRVKMDYLAKKYLEYHMNWYMKFYYLENDISGYLCDNSYDRSSYHAVIEFGKSYYIERYEISFMDRDGNYFDLDKVVEIISSIYR